MSIPNPNALFFNKNWYYPSFLPWSNENEVHDRKIISYLDISYKNQINNSKIKITIESPDNNTESPTQKFVENLRRRRRQKTVVNEEADAKCPVHTHVAVDVVAKRHRGAPARNQCFIMGSAQYQVEQKHLLVNVSGEKAVVVGHSRQTVEAKATRRVLHQKSV